MGLLTICLFGATKKDMCEFTMQKANGFELIDFIIQKIKLIWQQCIVMCTKAYILLTPFCIYITLRAFIVWC